MNRLGTDIFALRQHEPSGSDDLTGSKRRRKGLFCVFSVARNGLIATPIKSLLTAANDLT